MQPLMIKNYFNQAGFIFNFVAELAKDMEKTPIIPNKKCPMS
jgi:hypothetical protein